VLSKQREEDENCCHVRFAEANWRKEVEGVSVKRKELRCNRLAQLEVSAVSHNETRLS